MKKLLVLTDFTPNAFHAAAAALHLASQTGADIVLYHTLPYAPLIPSEGMGPYVTETAGMLFEDSKERLIQEADELREVAAMRNCKVDITVQNGEGSLSALIAELTGDPEADLVIMGGRAGGALEHLLSGSDTAAVIRKAKKPVLIIPMAASASLPKKLVFASDFGEADIAAASYLTGLAMRLGISLEVVHLILTAEGVTGIGAEVAFRKYLDLHRLSYTRLHAENVHQGLRQYGSQNGVGMLAMTHGRHSFIARILGHSETKAVIADQQLWLLVFPPDFKPSLNI